MTYKTLATILIPALGGAIGQGFRSGHGFDVCWSVAIGALVGCFLLRFG